MESGLSSPMREEVNYTEYDVGKRNPSKSWDIWMIHVLGNHDDFYLGFLNAFPGFTSDGSLQEWKSRYGCPANSSLSLAGKV